MPETPERQSMLNSNLWIKCGLCAFPMILGFSLWNKLPDDIPQNYNFNGEPGWTLPKFWGIITSPLLILALTIFLMVSASKDESSVKKGKLIGSWILAITSFIINSVMILKPAGYSIDINFVVIPVLSVVFILVGLYIPNTQPNHLVGVRAPWINNDPYVWHKVNTFGGNLFVITGIVDLLTCFTSIGKYVFLVTLLLTTVIVLVYSIIVSKQRQQHYERVNE